MIPSVVADEIRSAIVEYLTTTFALSDDDARAALRDFLDDPHDGIFRGPYVRVRTPYASVDDDWTPPLDWLPAGFRPYLHQARAFERLTTVDDHRPEPTIVTTGTGSGKTECFLLPILDHCARARAAGQHGIKALVLYPMNALATDQAERIAELVHRDPAIGAVTAGLYIGEQGRHSTMGHDHLIDRREILRADPPDILLTNYKMLDFLLLRREDRDLWAANEPDTLRYVVLDEFHTYDGAQGTDVAMLLRRLGRTLRMAGPDGPLGGCCPVATSATLGGDDRDTADQLRAFAARVFGTAFDDDAVIGERRLDVDDACGPVDYFLPIPDPARVAALAPDDVNTLAAAFCTAPDDGLDPLPPGDTVELGRRLLAHPLTRAVLAAVGDRPRSWADTVAEVVTRAPEWGRAHTRHPRPVETALSRYLQLLSLARRDDGTGQLRPLLSVEVQLWIREVTRVLRRVETTPHFRWLDSAAAGTDDEPTAPELPAVYCRRCGSSGWMAVAAETGDRLITRPESIYAAAVARRPTQRALLRTHPSVPDTHWYHPDHRRLTREPADDAVPVLVTPDEDAARRSRCPACGEHEGIRFLGTRVASLASVSISTLFGSDAVEHEQRKLLAFTDSVQDAAHRAAFFAGRTYRFNLRTLLTGAVPPDGAIPLDQLADLVFAGAHTPADLYALVPPDLLRDHRVRTTWTDDPDPAGLDILRRRVAFEAHLEFGLRARVGRTVELAAAAAAEIRPTIVADTTELVAEDLEHLLGEIPTATLTAIPTYLRGLLERLRLRGGIHHGFLDPYIGDRGRLWHLWGGRPDGLPPFTPDQSRPVFAVATGRADHFDALGAAGTTPTWYADWAARTLGIDHRTAARINPRVFELVAHTTDHLRAVRTPAGTVYALEPAAVVVADVPDDTGTRPRPSLLHCDTCGHRHATPPDSIAAWEGTPCLRYRCPGRFVAAEPDTTNYYRRLYRAGRPRRVVTAEHTGLLSRRQRENVETGFKRGDRPDAPNVITATPTLEMGIDIGELSAVMLTSVPPRPANYVQRIGRAGRRSGNALVTVFARSDTHDLYYLAEPRAMLDGEIRAPNCYLDAVETLHRQYVAYLVDRVADLTLDAPAPDTSMGRFMAHALDEEGFLRRLIDASQLEPRHVDDFLELFGDHLAADTVDDLRRFADTGIEAFLKSAVDRWTADIRELELRRDRINRAIRRLENDESPTPTTDERLADLKGQRAAIVRLLRDARDDYVFSGLERLGVLPNYTLLDDTVTLEVTLWSRTPDGEHEVDRYTYDRPAALAVREFAPGNSFYVGGHRHVIDAVEIGTAEQPLSETWRLCPDCGFGEIERDGENRDRCPRCASPAIADVGSRHEMLRLRTVRSSSPEERARVFDDTDERQREIYDVVVSADVDPAHVAGAWRLTDRAFGAEFARHARIRTINLGFADRHGDQIPIDGVTRHVTRFRICAHCGAAADARDDRGGTRPDLLHHAWCLVRSGARSEHWKHVLLHHELVTDAVRILLPVSLFEVDARLASFTGALRLGLRRDFGGDPDHLRVTRGHLPNRDGQGHYNMLVLYDSVPGGTGYLDRLADPDRMRTILESARELIARCQCVNEGRPACHRCLLGVTDRRDYELVSRELALDLLDDLLAGWDVDHTIDTVAHIPIATVEESELERRFRVALQDWAATRDDVTMHPIPGDGGRPAHELRFTDPSGNLVARYRLDEQEGLGTSPSTVPDYLIRRVDAPGRHIAIYLDGREFHASPRHNNIAADAAKRNGIRAGGARVWNLTWDDVDAFHAAVLAELPRRPPANRLLAGTSRTVARQIHTARGGPGLDYETVDLNPVELLLTYLRHPDDDAWSCLARSVVGGFAAVHDPRDLSRGELRPALERALTGQPPPEGPAPDPDGTGPVARVAHGTTAAGVPITAFLDLTDPNAERWTVFVVLPDRADDLDDPDHPPRWQDWLRWANVTQFLGARHDDRAAWIGAVSDPDTPALDDLVLLAGDQPDTGTAPATPGGPTDELDLVLDPDARDLARAVLSRGAPTFVAGHELDGIPVEVAWPDHRVGVLDADAPDVDVDGWQLRRAADWTPDDLMAALRGDH